MKHRAPCSLVPQLGLIGLIGLAGILAAADRGKSIVPRPNDPIPKAEVAKLTGDWNGPS